MSGWFALCEQEFRRGKRGTVSTKANMVRNLVLETAEANPNWGHLRSPGPSGGR